MVGIPPRTRLPMIWNNMSAHHEVEVAAGEAEHRARARCQRRQGYFSPGDT
jgi:hypothetical protein